MTEEISSLQNEFTRKQRYIIKRIIVRGTLVLDTPTCLGNGDAEGVTDLMLLRDSISSKALLTGASIAGALRNYLYEHQYGYLNSNEDKEENEQANLATYLFGAERKDENGDQSPLIIHDSISNEVPRVELRDGVRIKSTTGTADDGAKYDLELLATGTEFPLCFELVIEEGRDKNLLLEALTLALQGLENHEIGIGMKKRRGFGCCHVSEWRVWQFDLRKPSERLAWLTLDRDWASQYAQPPQQGKIQNILKQTILHPDKRDRFLIHATFNLVGSLLIRSGQDSTGRAPDVVHLKSHRPKETNPDEFNPESVLSGTSLAGVLRHQAERIVKTLGSCSPLVEQMFGFVVGKQSQASRLVVHEKEIKDATELVQNRIAIDRFTGGAYHGALFDEQPIFGGDNTIVTIELELRNPQEYEIGLLLLLLKDLWTSDLPVGGESSIGRGRLVGKKATLIWHRSLNPQEWEITQQKDETLSIKDKNNPSNLKVKDDLVKDELEKLVQEFLRHIGVK